VRGFRGSLEKVKLSLTLRAQDGHVKLARSRLGFRQVQFILRGPRPIHGCVLSLDSAPVIKKRTENHRHNSYQVNAYNYHHNQGQQALEDVPENHARKMQDDVQYLHTEDGTPSALLLCLVRRTLHLSA